LGRALVGQLIKIGYLLKVTTEPIGNNRVQSIELAKEEAICSVYGQKRLTGLVPPKVKTADRDRNIKGTVLQGQIKGGSCRLDYQHVSSLSNWLVHWSWP
jgi:hypothetical protein